MRSDDQVVSSRTPRYTTHGRTSNQFIQNIEQFIENWSGEIGTCRAKIASYANSSLTVFQQTLDGCYVLNMVWLNGSLRAITSGGWMSTGKSLEPEWARSTPRFQLLNNWLSTVSRLGSCVCSQEEHHWKAPLDAEHFRFGKLLR